MGLHGGGVLFGWLPTRRILELIYPGKEPPVFESRDLAWAWAFLIIGAVLIVWTVGRLVGRRPVIRAGTEGMFLSLGGPFRRPAAIPWGYVGEISTGVVSDDYGTFPTLLIRVDDPSLLTSRPWGARWINGGVLSIWAGEWDSDSGEVAERLMEVQAGRSGSPLEEAETQETSMEIDTPPAPPGEPETEVNAVTPVADSEGRSG